MLTLNFRFGLSATVVVLAAFPAGFTVSPVRVDLTARNTTAVVLIENPSGSRHSYQVSAVDWDQQEGEDRYRESTDLIVVPPMFDLEPGKRQIVRIGVRGLTENERAYRLFIQELPQLATSGESDNIQTLLRVSLPVFVASSLPRSAPDLVWTSIEDRRSCYSVENRSRWHVQIHSLKAMERTVPMGAFYILPGRNRQICLPQDAQMPSVVSIALATDRGDFRYEVPGDGR